ncbi:MAG: ABC transporter substrate-binding protein [Paracoccus denitrificans]|nr:MAG: ABC transporter substrate-binding protein [Paracoccus denitrificans]PZO83572.1 MAG: ABC transporter substrate-binding protein [Paracoccus denitrificans]
MLKLGAFLLTTAALTSGAVAQTATTPPATDDQVTTSHGIAIFGELKLPADFKHLPYVNPDAPKGGSISQAVPNNSNFDNFNPFTMKGRPAALSSAMLETLLARDASDFGAAYCLLCTTLEYPASRDWVIFNMRPDIKFADGSPMTADDVVYSINALMTEADASIRFIANEQIEKVEALSPSQVKVTFKPNYPRREIVQFVGGLPIMSKADADKRALDLDKTMDKPLLGSGPYALTESSMGRWVEVTRRDDYWGKNLPINIGRQNFDRMRYEYFADYDAAFQAFTAGDYTFRQENSAQKWANAYNFPAVQKGWVKVETLPDKSSVSGQAWVFNLRREKWQDPRVREAVGMMFNFGWTNQRQFYGLYDRVNSFWENSDLEATGKPTPEELALLEPLKADLPAEVFTEDAFSWPAGSENLQDRATMRRAMKLLDDAGWKIGADGLRRNAQNQTLRLEILNDSDSFDKVLNPYIENLRAIGVDAVNLRVDNSEAQARERAHNFDMTSTFLGQSPIPGAEMRAEFDSKTADNESNLLGLKNPAIDALIRKVEEANTEDELKIAVHALDRSLRAMKFWVPQWYNPNHLIAYYDQYGHPETLPDYDLGQLDFWWFDADKAEKLKQAGALR